MYAQGNEDWVQTQSYACIGTRLSRCRYAVAEENDSAYVMVVATV